MKTISICPAKAEPRLLADTRASSSLHNPVLFKRGDGPCPSQLYTIEDMHHRAETMTPLLETILNLRPPFR
jgi:hypothetical protein